MLARAEKERQDLAAAEEQKKIIEQLDPKLVQSCHSRIKHRRRVGP